MFEHEYLRDCHFRFNNEPGAIHQDRLKGLLKYGPFRQIPQSPRIAFVFPEGKNNYANRLFLALKNGIGAFKGVESLFRMEFSKESVFPVTGFRIPDPGNFFDTAQRYYEHIQNWCSENRDKPDIAIVLHPKTVDWDDETPYHYIKASLLSSGIVSQNVTFDLLDDKNQFEWSAANIALAMFAKMGGIPWTIGSLERKNSIVVGMGRSDTFDPQTRQKKGFIAFATCMRGDGVYRVSHFGQPTDDFESHLGNLKDIVRQALQDQCGTSRDIDYIVLHLPKEIGKYEFKAIKDVVTEEELNGQHPCTIHVLKVSDDDRFFAVDKSIPEWTPQKGLCLRLSDSEALLYTEGREERQAWRHRLPSTVHVRNQSGDLHSEIGRQLLTQVYDLSLMNWRAFNAKGTPITLLYSKLIAKILKHSKGTQISNNLNETLWFL